jgi:hypothetical protein
MVENPPTDTTTISGTSSTGDGENLTHETVRATGVLVKAEGTTYNYGTHAITDEALVPATHIRTLLMGV